MCFVSYIFIFVAARPSVWSSSKRHNLIPKSVWRHLHREELPVHSGHKRNLLFLFHCTKQSEKHMLTHILSTFVHKLYMYYKLKYIFSYITWIIFGNLWIPEWPILIDLPIIYTLNQIQYNWFFFYGCKGSSILFFQGMGWRVFKENNFHHKGWADNAYFL